MKKPDAIIIHPGMQHAWQLANATFISGEFRKVHFVTGFLISYKHPLSNFRLFKKRLKPVHPDVCIHNLLIFECCRLIHKWLNFRIGIFTNNADYFWQLCVNFFLIPFLFMYRKNSVLILYETAGWPLSLFAKRWKIPVIMDFPSISHEQAELSGIRESKFGKYLKTRERQNINFGFFCSRLSKSSYCPYITFKKSYILYPGTTSSNFKVCSGNPDKELRIACIANTEIRKGIDILLQAFNLIPSAKKLWLIGNLNKSFIHNICRKHRIDSSEIIFTGNISHKDMEELLLQLQIDLHILTSRFDAYGMVVAETMALGIPNIISPAVGISELLIHQNNVLISKEINPESLLEEIRYFQNLPPYEQENLRNRVFLKSKEISWTGYYQQVKEAYQDILANTE